MNEILIYKESASFPGGRAYLCADGCLSSERSQAQAFWDIQFDAVVAENWIVRPAKVEFTGNVSAACPVRFPTPHVASHQSKI